MTAYTKSTFQLTNRRRLQQQIYHAGVWSILLFISAILYACSSSDIHMIETQQGTESDADQLMIVDCLLPGSIKKLGRSATYVTPRRPAKLTARDCQNRGGEYTAYREANTASALKVWLSAAQKGDVVAQTYVGEIYEKGRGIQPDYRTAAAWYYKAAQQGHPRARLNLGYLYEKGLGVKKNIKTALQLYREASGLANTNIEYVANIDVAPGNLQNNVLSQLKNELESERKNLKSLKQQVAKKQNQILKKQQIVSQQERALSVQRKTILAEKQKANVDRKKIRRLQGTLAKRQNEIKIHRRETDSLKKQLDKYRAELASVQDGGIKIAVAGPSIQMLNPPLLSVRGIPRVGISPQIKTREIIGQITAPAGISQILINNTKTKFSKNGIFKYLTQIKDTNTEMRITAIDNQGKRAELEFVFVKSDTPIVARNIPSLPKSSGKFGKFYALVIGNNSYLNFPKLSTAITDAKQVANILSKRYGFQTTTLINANRFMMLAALNRLSKKLEKNDNLLIYYAGHGELDKQKTGFWLPVDASRTDKRKWISNTAITDILNAMDVKRILVVADSCYSGTLTRSAIAQIDTSASDDNRFTILRTLAKSRARTALVSGGLKPVADKGEGGKHSVFANAFINVLEKNNGIIEGQRLHREIQARMAVSPIAVKTGQLPEYAPIQHAGHESGEFFLLPRKSSSDRALLELILTSSPL